MGITLTIYSSLFSLVFALLLVSLLLSIGLSIYTLRIQDNRAANTFGLLLMVISVWVLLKIIALFISDIDIRKVLHLINILVLVLITPLLFLVGHFHTQTPKWFGKKQIPFLFIFPAFIYFLVFLSAFKNLLFTDFQIEFRFDIPIHIFKKSLLYNLLDIYNYLLIICTFIILFSALSKKNIYLRRQMVLFIIGLLIPIVYDSLYILGYSPIKNYNLSPVFLSIGNIFLAWSMLGYRMFKVLPVARNLVLDSMQDIMIITSYDNLVVDINKSGEELFNANKEEILGKPFHEVFARHQGFKESYLKKSKLKEISIERDGIKRYFSISQTTIGQENYSTVNIILLHDITERIRAESQIRRLSVAIEQSPVTIVITDLVGNIEYVNPAFCKITGYSAEEAMGNNPRILKGSTPPSTFKDMWDTVLAGKVWQGEFINRKKSGDYYYEDAIIAPVKNDEGEIISFIAIKNDISGRKEAENKIQKQNIELKELNATKDKFFSIIAHDLRNPFSAILGLSEYLINHNAELDKPEMLTHIIDINKAADQTYRLLENLLEWSRYNRGIIKPKIQKNNLKVLAADIIAFSSEIAKIKSIDLRNNILQNIYVECDIEMTRTILRNLVSNAIKFTHPQGHVTLDASIQGDYAEIHITDNGVGIPDESLGQIFTIDKNKSTKGTANESGTGLGLILCKELVEVQGGKIWAQSKVGSGSTFSFTLSVPKE